MKNMLEVAIAGQSGMYTKTDFQKLVARLDLFTESIILTEYDEGQPVTAREIDSTDLVATFSGQPLVTGILPRNCIHYSRWGGKEHIAIIIPAHQVRVSFLDMNMLIPLPTLVFLGRETSYSVLAIKAQWPTEKEKLYRAPFPNVSLEGRICQGNVPFPVCDKSTIHKAADLFLSSGFNRHWVGGKSQKYPTAIPRLWRDITGEEAYPIEDLVSARITLANFLKDHLR